MSDYLYGSVRYPDGSIDKGVTGITSSWNSNRGKNDGKGNYKLDFGGRVGKKVTIYVNGSKYSEVLVEGATRLDIVVKT